MKEPRVKQIIEAYKAGSIEKVYKYLTQPDMVVDPSTWAGNIKRLIEDEKILTVKEFIELTAYKFIKK
jgi:hypothetical protein